MWTKRAKSAGNRHGLHSPGTPAARHQQYVGNCGKANEAAAPVRFLISAPTNSARSTGAIARSLASQLGRVIVGDAQGHVHVLTTAALLRGEVDCVTFRAHDGKAATLHCRTYDEMLLTGGGDGWVRKWSCDRIGEQARLTRRRHL